MVMDELNSGFEEILSVVNNIAEEVEAESKRNDEPDKLVVEDSSDSESSSDDSINEVDFVKGKMDLDEILKKHDMEGFESAPMLANEKNLHEVELMKLPEVLTVSQDDITILGKVLNVQANIVDENTRIIVQGTRESWIDINSLICVNEGTIIGRVEEVFGPIDSPFFSVRIQNINYTKEKLDAIKEVYYSKSHQKQVDRHEMEQQLLTKGCDASDGHGLEADAGYSDDEMESRAKKKKKQKVETRTEDAFNFDSGGNLVSGNLDALYAHLRK